MTATQKYAWFNLIVITLTAATILLLYPIMGHKALGGFGLLGFLGFVGVFFRKAQGHVVADERDHLIWSRSVAVAYSVFWVCFVIAATVLAPLSYGWEGTVPVAMVSLSVADGVMLVLGVQSVVILLQYARGAADA